MKKCFRCNIEKPLSEFYTHPRMADGHLNKCKECTKSDSQAKYLETMNDPAKKFKEAVRQAEKQAKYRKMGTAAVGDGMRGERDQRTKYPEKYMARSLSQHIAIKNGEHRHHWSYNQEHSRDVIIMPKLDHIQIHRYIVYDQERKMYRRLDGVLVDTREHAEQYYEYVLSLEKRRFPDYAYFDSIRN